MPCPHFHVQQDFFSGAKNITHSSNECNDIHATSEMKLKVECRNCKLKCVYNKSITEVFYQVGAQFFGVMLNIERKKHRSFNYKKLQQGVADASPKLFIGIEVGVLAHHVVGISGCSAVKPTWMRRHA